MTLWNFLTNTGHCERVLRSKYILKVRVIVKASSTQFQRQSRKSTAFKSFSVFYCNQFLYFIDLQVPLSRNYLEENGSSFNLSL